MDYSNVLVSKQTNKAHIYCWGSHACMLVFCSGTVRTCVLLVVSKAQGSACLLTYMFVLVVQPVRKLVWLASYED